MDMPEPIGMPVQRMMVVVVFGVLVIGALFALLALVRMWGLRMQKQSGASGGLDLEALRHQRDTGQISQEEYEAVRGQIAGAGPPGASKTAPESARADAAPETPIKDSGAAGGAAERSPSDGQE